MLKRVKTENTELEALRTLLFKDELKALDSIEERVGNDKTLTESVTDVLPVAIQNVRERNPRDLNRAMGPIVVSGVQSHIKNSQDDFVEMMVPIMGRMIAGMVKKSVQDLSDNINAKIETKFSPQGIIAAIKAKSSGRPLSDFLLASSLLAKLEKALILEKSSGKILAAWREDDDDDDAVSDEESLELVSGLLAALTNLSEEVFDSAAGGIKTIELDGHQIAIRRTGKFMLVLEISGLPNSHEQSLIEKAFDAAREKIGANEAAAALEHLTDLAGQFERNREKSTSDTKPGSALKRYLKLGIALLFFGAITFWAGSALIHTFQLNSDMGDVQSVLDMRSSIEGFPLNIEYDHKSEFLIISGLVPETIDIESLTKELETKLPHRDIDIRVTKVRIIH